MSEATSADLTGLLAAIISALKGSASDIDENAKQALLMQNAMMILGGNWTPFDKVRPALKEFVVEDLKGDLSAANRASYVNHLSCKAEAALAENAAVSTELATSCKDDADPLGHTKAMLEKHLAVLLDLILDYADEAAAPFSTPFRDAFVDFSGEWLEGLSKSMNEGDAGLKGFMQKLSFVGSQTIMTKYPQHAQMAMFGLPMALNMMNNFHTEYRKKNGISVPASPASPAQ